MAVTDDLMGETRFGIKHNYFTVIGGADPRSDFSGMKRVALT